MAVSSIEDKLEMLNARCNTLQQEQTRDHARIHELEKDIAWYNEDRLDLDALLEHVASTDTELGKLLIAFRTAQKLRK